jgi:small subunit ribosomal protein S20
MPHTRSAKKNQRKTRKRRMKNRLVKSTIKSQMKRVLTAKPGASEDLQKDFRLAVKQLDKAAAKGVIHANQAARRKSQLAKHLNKAGT